VRAALQEPGVTAKNGGINMSIILMDVGGNGKCKSMMVNEVITTLKWTEDWGEDNYTVFITTGLAVTNAHRSMVHSWMEGLGFPVNEMACKELKGQTQGSNLEEDACKV
jgi:hypothetical protein